jgi:2-dehydro-3-deoxyphosphogluconate aldolase/(4S)-4-hydroxy-2-oxoglutarate aldolase
LPAVVIDREEDAPRVAAALSGGGIDVMEIMLRTPAAVGGIRLLKEAVPDFLVGAGTVLQSEQVDEVIEAGAAFGVAPGLNEAVARRAKEKGFTFVPGVATPSEIERAAALGFEWLKFFPAEALGGSEALRMMAGPYGHLDLKFVPTGGIENGNLGHYLELPMVGAVAGTWIAPRKVIQREGWDEIAARARAALDVIRRLENEPTEDRG